MFKEKVERWDSRFTARVLPMDMDIVILDIILKMYCWVIKSLL